MNNIDFNNKTFLISLIVGLFIILCFMFYKNLKIVYLETKHDFRFSSVCFKCGRNKSYQDLICFPIVVINDLEWKLNSEIRKNDELRAETLRLKDINVFLENAIKKHRDEKGHARCWLSDLELYKVLGEEINEKDFILPCKEEFLTNCEKYWEKRQPKTEGKFFSAEEIAALRDEYYIKHPDIKGLLDILEKLRDK